MRRINTIFAQVFSLGFLINWATFTFGFQSRSTRLRSINQQLRSQPIYKQSYSDFKLDNGAKIFEQWFLEKTKRDGDNYKTLSKVRHNIFSNGIRGLEYIGSSPKLNENIITIPKDIVIHSQTDGNNLLGRSNDHLRRWDVSLAIRLLDECSKGHESFYYGYCQLLTQGLDFNKAQPCPPSVAPNALRNWSQQQKDFLAKECGPRGIELLQLEYNQKQDWLAQYSHLATQDHVDFSFEQFVWAMEVVYSRSFRGDFVTDLPSRLSTLIIPFAATALGLNYLLADPNQSNNLISIALGLIGFLPLILKSLDQDHRASEAVLLPFIDSANHMEQAQSQILFDPLKGEFILKYSSESAFVDDRDGDGRRCKQMYISYGDKRETELLLNYGFFPGVDYDEIQLKEMDLDQRLNEQRNALVKAYSKKAK